MNGRPAAAGEGRALKGFHRVQTENTGSLSSTAQPSMKKGVVSAFLPPHSMETASAGTEEDASNLKTWSIEGSLQSKKRGSESSPLPIPLP